MFGFQFRAYETRGHDLESHVRDVEFSGFGFKVCWSQVRPLQQRQRQVDCRNEAEVLTDMHYHNYSFCV